MIHALECLTWGRGAKSDGSSRKGGNSDRGTLCEGNGKHRDWETLRLFDLQLSPNNIRLDLVSKCEVLERRKCVPQICIGDTVEVIL